MSRARWPCRSASSRCRSRWPCRWPDAGCGCAGLARPAADPQLPRALCCRWNACSHVLALAACLALVTHLPLPRCGSACRVRLRRCWPCRTRLRDWLALLVIGGLACAPARPLWSEHAARLADAQRPERHRLDPRLGRQGFALLLWNALALLNRRSGGIAARWCQRATLATRAPAVGRVCGRSCCRGWPGHCCCVAYSLTVVDLR